MGQIRFYLDENVDHAVARGLNRRGFVCITTVDAKMRSAKDEQHLRYAAGNGFSLVTQDEDFLILHSSGLRHCGIVYSPQGTTIGDLIRGLMLIAQVMDSDSMIDHLEFI